MKPQAFSSFVPCHQKFFLQCDRTEGGKGSVLTFCASTRAQLVSERAGSIGHRAWGRVPESRGQTRQGLRSYQLSVIGYRARSGADFLDEGLLANEPEVIGRQAGERRVEGNRENEFAQFFSTLEGPEKIYWRRKSANEERKETREAGCAITC